MTNNLPDISTIVSVNGIAKHDDAFSFTDFARYHDAKLKASDFIPYRGIIHFKRRNDPILKDKADTFHDFTRQNYEKIKIANVGYIAAVASGAAYVLFQYLK